MGAPARVGVIEDMITDYQDAIELSVESSALHDFNPTSTYAPDMEDTRGMSPVLSGDVTASVESARNIKRAWHCFQASGRGWQDDLFARICFTVIEVPSEDLAFTFFDTQNNRGVPLHATDLLKAFHLRAIVEPKREMLQTNCAKRWEQLQRTQPILGLAGDFAPALFNTFL